MTKKRDKKEILKEFNEFPEGYFNYLEYMGIELLPWQKECVCRVLSERKQTNTIPRTFKTKYAPLLFNGGAK